MSEHMPDDLSIKGQGLRAFTDKLRTKHRVVKNIANEWVLLKHADVITAALDHDRFSNHVYLEKDKPDHID